MEPPLATYRARIDERYSDLVRRFDIAGALVGPQFTAIWSCFAEWFPEPVAGIKPSQDLYEFGAGFIDGDPERSRLEIEPPDGLTWPLVELGLVRSFAVANPDVAAASLGVGRVAVVWHYRLTDEWRRLRDLEARYWINGNPLGWTSHGWQERAVESLRATESTNAFRLASEHQPLRVEIWGPDIDDAIILSA